MFTSPISYDKAQQLDKILNDLAVYECTGGKAFLPESREEFIDFQKRINAMFNRMKVAIQKGEMTFRDMESHIVARNAAILQPQDTQEVDIDAVIKGWEQTYDEHQTHDEHQTEIDILQGFVDYLRQAAMKQEIQSDITEKNDGAEPRDSSEQDE